MIKIAHRINTISQLKSVSKEYGIEVDVRYRDKDLILHHDPFVDGENFDEFLKNFNHRLIILNIKTEGIEDAVINLLKKYDIKNYFFLDLSLPFLIKYAKKGEKNIAVRFSEYEPLEFILKFKGLVDWVWVDCFNNLPLDDNNYKILKNDFKICLVSPELQGYPVERIREFKTILKNKPVDAVCTKAPELW